MTQKAWSVTALLVVAVLWVREYTGVGYANGAFDVLKFVLFFVMAVLILAGVGALLSWRVMGWRSAIPLMIVLVALTLWWPTPYLVPDAALRWRFAAFRSAYDRVGARLAANNNDTDTRRQLAALGVADGAYRSDSAWLMAVETRAFAGDFAEKGYAYSESGSLPTEASLDQLSARLCATTRYRALSAHWYLYAICKL